MLRETLELELLICPKLLGHIEQEKGMFSGVGVVLLDGGVSLNMVASLPRASGTDLRKCLEYPRM